MSVKHTTLNDLELFELILPHDAMVAAPPVYVADRQSFQPWNLCHSLVCETFIRNKRF